MTLIHARSFNLMACICLVLFGMGSRATPLDDSSLADQALAIIGARVPNSSQKCAACHSLNAPKLRSWFDLTSRVSQECLGPWFNSPSKNTAASALNCISLNGSSPFQWSPRQLGLWAARVKSEDFTSLFQTGFETSAENELNRFRQRTFMPRSGAPGFNDQEWSLVREYIDRGAPLLEEKLSGHASQTNPTSPASVKDVVVRDDLQSPWSVNTSPDGQIWITELGGQIKIFDAQFQLLSTLTGLPDLQPYGQGGLLDLAFHPKFLQNGWIYLSYTVSREGGYNTQINRFTYRNGQLSERKIILNGPSGTDGAHFGSRLVFDEAGFLYATFGERHQKEKAQNLDSLHGKIVRLTDEGEIPRDNPFPGSPIFTFGHRNPQGLAIHPVSKHFFESEHGPSGYDAPGGGDEINLIKVGQNYGWPVIHHRQTKEGMISPLAEYTPSIAPSGVVFYTGNKIPQWKNDFFVATLAGATLFRFTINSEDKIIHEEKLLEDKYGRLRDVGNAPDGTLLVISDDGQLIQLRPQ